MSSTTSGVGTRSVVASAEPQLLEITSGLIDQMDLSAERRQVVETLDAVQVSIVPLRARDTLVGACLLGTRGFSGRRFTTDDHAFHQVLGGRIALAIDNVGLDSGLREAERRLGAALGELDEAVIISRPAGELLYINEAAVRLFGMDCPQAAMIESPLQTADFADPDGRAIAYEDLPWGAPDGRANARQRLVQLRTEGHDRIWLLARVSTTGSDEDNGEQIVTVLQDVSPLKRDEIRARVRADVGAVFTAPDEDVPAQLAEIIGSSLSLACTIELAGTGRAPSAAHVFTPPQWQPPPDSGGHLALQMKAMGEEVGWITVAGTEIDEPFIAELAQQVAQGISTWRLTRERSATNAALQRGLRPSELPKVPDWELACLHRPAGTEDQVGGDFYDVFKSPNGWVALIGDVTGHGARAARLTAVSRFALRAVLELTGDLLTSIRQLNRMLLAEPELSLVTLACALLPDDPASDEVEIVRCGHPAPLLLRSRLGVIEEFGSTAPLLGAFEDADWVVGTTVVRPGDSLLLYTDGITDHVGEGERFGLDRLMAIINAPASPAELVADIERALEQFGDERRHDDEAVLALQRTAAWRPSMSV